MPTEEQIQALRDMNIDTENATYILDRHNPTILRAEDTSGRWAWIRQANGIRAEYISVNEPTEVVKEEPKEEKNEIEGVDYVYDDRGTKVYLPIAVLQEEYVFSKTINGNEERIEDYVNLKIIEQKSKCFEFHKYLDRDDGEFYEEDEYDDLKYCTLRSSVYDGPHYYGSDYYALYLFEDTLPKGHSRNINYQIPASEYVEMKTFLEHCGVQIIPDETEREIEVVEENNVSYVYNEEPSEEEIEKMLKLVDIKKFNKIIKARLSCDGTTTNIEDFNDKATKNYLKQWAINKYKYYKMFGDKLTLEADVEVERDEREVNEFREMLKEKFPLYRWIFHNISLGAITENTIKTKSACYINEGYFEDEKVKNHMSFTKFISLYNNKELDTEVSKFYQTKGTAHLVVSIDPIDYLTVSINKSGWKSCHHFFAGQYRNAGLSYMNDETSLVAYRSNGEVTYTFEGKKIEWNSKSWRQMVYMSRGNSAIVFSRQYPYNNEQLTFNIRQMMEECVSNFFGSNNKWTIYRKRENMKVRVPSHEYAILYNDVCNGFDFDVVKAKDDENKDKQVSVEIGAKVVGVLSGDRVSGENRNIW